MYLCYSEICLNRVCVKRILLLLFHENKAQLFNLKVFTCSENICLSFPMKVINRITHSLNLLCHYFSLIISKQPALFCPNKRTNIINVRWNILAPAFCTLLLLLLLLSHILWFYCIAMLSFIPQLHSSLQQDTAFDTFTLHSV